MKKWPPIIAFICLLSFLVYVSKSPSEKFPKTSKGAFSPPIKKFEGIRTPTSIALSKNNKIKNKNIFSNKLNHQLKASSRPGKRSIERGRSPASRYFEGTRSLTSGGIQFKVSDNLAAVALRDYSQALGASVFQNYGHQFYKSNSAVDDSLNYREDRKIVLQNGDTGQVALLTGNILVQLHDGQSAPAPAPDKMILVSSQPQLDLYTYRPLDSQSIVALKEQLAASGHYKTVQLEIIQGGAHAK